MVAVVIVGTSSVPLYPAAMPSWYVLFLASAAGAIARGDPQRIGYGAHRGLAGRCAGLACAREGHRDLRALRGASLGAGRWRARPKDRSSGAERSRFSSARSLSAILVPCDSRASASQPTARDRAHIALPPDRRLCLPESRCSSSAQGRARGFGVDLVLWRRLAVLVAGAAVPTLIYAGWLAQHDALTPFLASVHAVVGKRASFASLPPPSVRSILYALPVLAIVLGGRRLGVRPRLLVPGGIVLGVLAWWHPYVHAGIWDALRGLLPAGALMFAAYWGVGRIDVDATDSPTAGVLGRRVARLSRVR